MASVGAKCYENQYRPECGFMTPLNNGVNVCGSKGECHKLDEEQIEERLDYIRRSIHANAHKKGYTVSADTLYFLLQLVDGLKARNHLLESRVFNGFNINGQTDYAGLRDDLLEAMDNNESKAGCNVELLGLIKRRQL